MEWAAAMIASERSQQQKIAAGIDISKLEWTNVLHGTPCTLPQTLADIHFASK